MTDHKKLRELAEAVIASHAYIKSYEAKGEWTSTCSDTIFAAVYPQTVIALLDEVERLREALKDAENTILLMIGDIVYMSDRANEANRFRDTVDRAQKTLELIEALQSGDK